MLSIDVYFYSVHVNKQQKKAPILLFSFLQMTINFASAVNSL